MILIGRGSLAPDKMYYNIKCDISGRMAIPDGCWQGMAAVLAGVYLAASASRRPSGETAPRQADIQYTR